MKFTKQHCLNISRSRKGRFTGKDNPHWRGGRAKFGDKGKYIGIHLPTHPFASKLGYVSEHRLVMEKHLGRYLLPGEIVHHINGDVKDNKIENLSLSSSQSVHATEHNKNRKRDKVGRFV